MTRGYWIGAILAGAIAVAGCGSKDTTTVVTVEGDRLTIVDGKVVLHGSASSTAEISGDGSLAINGKAVTLTDSERANLVRYHSVAMAFIDHAKETGVAGAEVGMAAANEVVKGLSSGDTSKIGEKIEAKVGPVTEAAGKLCADLATIVDLQAAIGAELEAFKPFSVVSAQEPVKCRKDLDKVKAKDAAAKDATSG